jgi:hypothetical protein
VLKYKSCIEVKQTKAKFVHIHNINIKHIPKMYTNYNILLLINFNCFPITFFDNLIDNKNH